MDRLPYRFDDTQWNKIARRFPQQQTHGEHLRQEALALFDTELSNAEIGRRIGVSCPTISQWRTRYRKEGAIALQLAPPGPQARLIQEQLNKLATAPARRS